MDWFDIIKEERSKEYFRKIITFVQFDARVNVIYPAHKDLFNAFHLCPYDNVKVVILGQDPYIGPGQAHGLAFSVPAGVDIPPSLRNIFKELHNDIGVPTPTSGCLEKWAKQGLLLLNTSLTVRAGESGSHKDFGWQIFTDKIISVLNEKETPIVFLLWGKHAQSKAKLITRDSYYHGPHLVLCSPHPSPLSAHWGFFDSKPFSKTNEFLIKNNIAPIDWTL